MDESQSLSHLEVTRCYWKALEKIVSGEGIVIDGTALDIPHVVAVAR